MKSPTLRECLLCSMPAQTQKLTLDELPAEQQCLKCDSNIFLQHDGSCLTSDIAHQRETIVEAMQKLERVILRAWEGPYKSVRLIVGTGQIRDEVLGQLHYYEQCQYILSYNPDSPNYGAVLLQIRA